MDPSKNGFRRPTCALVACGGLMIASGLAGCGGAEGPPRGSVAGSVTLDGQPVDGGTIYFYPTGETRGPMATATIAAGSFSLKARQHGPVVGTHRVKIEWYRASGQTDSGGAPVSEQAIPQRYNAETLLTVDVDAGKNKRDFELSSN